MANLFDKLGGREPLFQLVENVYDLMKANPKLGKMFKAEFDVAKLTKRTADFLENNWGGSQDQCLQQSQNEASFLFQAHSSVGVTDKDYTIMVQLYDKTLKKMGIGKALIHEICEDLERYRDPIVDPKQKHRAKWLNSNKISAADEAAWKKAAEAERQKEQERKERFANFRRERKKQEQLQKKRERELEKQNALQKQNQSKQNSKQPKGIEQGYPRREIHKQSAEEAARLDGPEEEQQQQQQNFEQRSEHLQREKDTPMADGTADCSLETTAATTITPTTAATVATAATLKILKSQPVIVSL
eukprot:TRINITY_DN6775_c0_g2_i1.p1 TRINITY_DN6775_c0_g2~~TRINITY_DN6775_c0_g2_i1.p1  ORF type:complete len:351 (+),score=100.80 TRINITY_DN6775_c0_g2_i1:149-1054(+)